MPNEDLEARIETLDEELSKWGTHMQAVIDCYGLRSGGEAQIDGQTLADLAALFKVRMRDLKIAINAFRAPQQYARRRTESSPWGQHLG